MGAQQSSSSTPSAVPVVQAAPATAATSGPASGGSYSISGDYIESLQRENDAYPIGTLVKLYYEVYSLFL